SSNASARSRAAAAPASHEDNPVPALRAASLTWSPKPASNEMLILSTFMLLLYHFVSYHGSSSHGMNTSEPFGAACSADWRLRPADPSETRWAKRSDGLATLIPRRRAGG